MMCDFVSVASLKKEPYVPSCEMHCAHHCAMDIALEELSALKDVNSLVIGVGECCFYSKKQMFAEPQRNWSYQLTDSELIFGDLSGIRDAIAQISSNGLLTVCIVTCIPSVMNLDVETAVAEAEQAVLLKAPDFSGISSNDILGDLYCALAQDVKPSATQERAVWNRHFDRVSEFHQQLNARTHLVYDRKFLPALQWLAQHNSMQIIDQTGFYSLSFYKENRDLLGIHCDDLTLAEDLLERIKQKNAVIHIKSAYGCDLALFLHRSGCSIGQLVLNGIDRYRFNQCKQLPRDTQVSLNGRSQLLLPGLQLDLSGFDAEFQSRSGFDRLLWMLKKAEELCH